MSTDFTALGITTELSNLLQQDGISSPTPIQLQSIPLLLKGEDIIAQAQTGTGKTIAFALPVLQRIDTNKDQVQALILTPTRELAIQITGELKKLATAIGARVLAAYGGQDVDAQIRKLRQSPHIVIATPGRLADHMRRETISLGKLSMLVLDEADQMLHMGFLPEVEAIIMQTPKARQTMLFSATIPDAIRRLALDYMKAPADIRIRSANVTLDNISQLVIETSDRGKQKTLVQLLQQHQPYLAVIFCRTKVRAKKLNSSLQDQGFESDELHGDLTQAKREQVMKRFREAKLQILVATDVAARGLDVEGVTHVYNYDVPQDGEHYIHRIGRTGRAGHEGMAITLATPYDRSALLDIEQSIKTKLVRRKPDHDENSAASMKDLPSERKKRTGSYGQADRAGSSRRGGSRSRGAKSDYRTQSSGINQHKRAGKSSEGGNPWAVTSDDKPSRNGGGRRNSSQGDGSRSITRNDDGNRSRTRKDDGKRSRTRNDSGRSVNTRNDRGSLPKGKSSRNESTRNHPSRRGR